MNQYSINKLANHIKSKTEYGNKTIQDIYKLHNYKTHYIKDNYKKAIKVLLDQDVIELLDKKGNRTNRITYTAKLKYL